MSANMSCPRGECGSENVEELETALYECQDCGYTWEGYDTEASGDRTVKF